MRGDSSDDSLDDMIRIFKQIEKELNKFFDEIGLKTAEGLSIDNPEVLSSRSKEEEPLIDVLQEGDKISILIDARGLKAEDIQLELINDRRLRIITPTWSKEVDLRTYVNSSKSEVHLNNTVLSIVLERKTVGQSHG